MQMIWISLFSLLFLGGCGNTKKGTDVWKSRLFAVDAPAECSVESQNKFVYDVLHDSYIWADEVNVSSYSANDYNTSEKVLKAFKNVRDSFSFIMSAKDEQSYFQEGKNTNFGFDFIYYAPTDESQYGLLISYVYPDSPAAKSGIKRGEIIIKINEQNITKENYKQVPKKLEDDNATLVFMNAGVISTKTIQKATYNINPILYHNVFTSGNHRVGYMVFQDFIDTAIPSLDKVFTSFKQDNVNDLILDLRYNGGGSDKIAGHLALLIGGSNVAGNVMHQVRFNQRYARYNYDKYFEKSKPNALNLNRLFVLTTKATCSASELVINVLGASKNHIEVIQIGSATCGKPYGYAEAGIFCDKALFAIDLRTTNADGVGDYIDGLIPTCAAEDGYFNDFGDTDESMLQEAFYYINNSSCSNHKAARSTAESKNKVLKLPKTGFRRIMGAY